MINLWFRIIDFDYKWRITELENIILMLPLIFVIHEFFKNFKKLPLNFIIHCINKNMHIWTKINIHSLMFEAWSTITWFVWFKNKKENQSTWSSKKMKFSKLQYYWSLAYLEPKLRKLKIINPKASPPLVICKKDKE